MAAVRILVILTISLALVELEPPPDVGVAAADHIDRSKSDASAGPAALTAPDPAPHAHTLALPDAPVFAHAVPALRATPVPAPALDDHVRPVKGPHCVSFSGTSPPAATV